MSQIYLNNFSSKKTFFKKVSLVDDSQVLFIYDKKLAQFKEFFQWVSQFRNTIPVQAGESLKSLSQYEKVLLKILKKHAPFSTQTFTIISVGGGSVGDFCGFLASTLRRGVNLIHIPSTWLATIDSAHGGKTALNISGYKNQIGTFYKAKSVILIKSLLNLQPPELAYSAYGELFKIALINGGPLYKKVFNDKHTFSKPNSTIWSLLPEAISAKLKVVKKDPLEKKGHRQVLNLGHTVGHIFESQLGLNHGVSVFGGLLFSLNWSFKKKLISNTDYEKINIMFHNFSLQFFKEPQKINGKSFYQSLKQDKKMSQQDKLTFLFIKKPGTVLRKKVTLEEVFKEALRQGLIRNKNQSSTRKKTKTKSQTKSGLM